MKEYILVKSRSGVKFVTVGLSKIPAVRDTRPPIIGRAQFIDSNVGSRHFQVFECLWLFCKSEKKRRKKEEKATHICPR